MTDVRTAAIALLDITAKRVSDAEKCFSLLFPGCYTFLLFILVDHCADVACGAHGECESFPALGTYECHCVPGWEGQNCDRQTCLGVTCFNGGSCG